MNVLMRCFKIRYDKYVHSSCNLLSRKCLHRSFQRRLKTWPRESYLCWWSNRLVKVLFYKYLNISYFNHYYFKYWVEEGIFEYGTFKGSVKTAADGASVSSRIFGSSRTDSPRRTTDSLSLRISSAMCYLFDQKKIGEINTSSDNSVL
jgi:hypothetical protein